MSERILAYIKITIAMSLIGVFIAINKVLSVYFPVFLFSGLRLGIAALLFILLVIWKEKSLPRLNRRDAGILLIQSFLGIFLFSIFLMYGIRFISAIESGIITSLTPAMVGVVSFFIFKEVLRSHQILGIGLALIGTISIHIFGATLQSTWSYSFMLGTLLILLAIFGEAIFITFGKLISSQLSPLSISACIIIMGAIMFLPFSIVEAISFDFSQVSAMDWLLVFFSATIVTVGAVILMNQAVKVLAVGDTAVFTAIIPLTTVLVSYIFLDEAIHWYHILAFLVILFGIKLVSTNKGQQVERTNKCDPGEAF